MAAAEAIPPPLQGPTSKERKYDRQLRLWAANGQAALEDARILLVNSGPGVVGVETLKNLVLPGVGHFTILDSATVTEADLGVNFFLEDDGIGASRAERCCRLLQELNPDVQGNYVNESFNTFFTRPDALSQYTLILVVLPVSPQVLDLIAQHAYRNKTAVFYIHSLGFYSHFTVQLPSAFPIVDTHPDPSSVQDLRLLDPWPELLSFAREKTQGMQDMDNEQHGHIPYVLLLLHYLEQWKTEHAGQVPQNYKDKAAFRDLVRQGARTNTPEGGEENFDEAVAAVLKSLNSPTPSSAVKEVLEALECRQLRQESPDFWVIAHAIQDFYAKHSTLPLSGSLPDMKAKSADYIELQNIYKTKARKDVAEVFARVQELDKELGRPVHTPQKEVEAFCKSASHVKLVRGRTPQLAKSPVSWNDRSDFAVNNLSNPESLILLYISFLAWDNYVSAHKLFDSVTSGTQKESLHASDNHDAKSAKITSIAYNILENMLKEAQETVDEPEYTEVKEGIEKYVQELVRADGGELHNIAAFTGGMVAQEVIKVITKQYIPIDNTCLFDGIQSKTSVMRL